MRQQQQHYTQPQPSQSQKVLYQPPPHNNPYQQPSAHQRYGNRSTSFTPPNYVINPYGMKFGEEGRVRQNEQQQYRRDLDYLVSLRKPYGDMTQHEWEAHNRKINYMNDVITIYIYIYII
jgi:hypothetical protein